MLETTLTYIQTNWIEMIGAVLSLIYLYCSVNQKIALWIFGFLSSAFYIVIFFNSKFYADATLQVYYLIISIYGIINWKKGTKISGEGELPITIINKKQWFELCCATLLVFTGYFIVLNFFTDSPVPMGDSFTTALCIVGTWMLARKMLENWLFFILADAILVGLFIYKSLYITAVLYAIYTIIAVFGYFKWKNSIIAKNK